MDIKGNHSLQGLNFLASSKWDNQIIINNCKIGSSCCHIKDWTKRIKHSTLLAINGQPVSTISDATQLLNQLVKTKTENHKLSITASATKEQSIHYEEGIPMLFFDQLSTIANHLSEIKYNTRSSKVPSIKQINNSSNTSSNMSF